MKYFSISELVRSDTAKRLGINNLPTSTEREALERLVNNVLDPLRERWGKPINVNSGFRCPELNRAVGGVSQSQHLKGEAADITAGSKAANKRLMALAIEMGLPYDQLIDESNYKWIHVSYSLRNRKEVKHL